MFRISLLAILITCSSIKLLSQNSAKYIIKVGYLFNSESGEFQKGMAILINGKFIEEVKQYKNLTDIEVKDYKLIDLSHSTVLPGLIDAHTHLLYKETLYPNNLYGGLDMVKTLTLEGDARRAIFGTMKAKAYLDAGITSVQDLGNSGMFIDIALRKSINEGLILGPRMRCAGRGLSSEGGQLPGLAYKSRSLINDEYRIITSPSDGVQAVRENVTQGADVIKLYSDNIPNNTMLSYDEIKAIVNEAHRYGLRVTAHAITNQAIYTAVIAGVDGIEHAYEVADSTLELMARRKVILVPTDGDSVTYSKYARLAYPGNPQIETAIISYRRALSDRLKRAIKIGVVIVAGSDDYIDFGLEPSESSKRTLIGYFEAGMTIPDILKYATINAAIHLRWGNELGIIKKGFLADIIAVDSELFKNIRSILNVHFVMKQGVIHLQKQVNN